MRVLSSYPAFRALCGKGTRSAISQLPTRRSSSTTHGASNTATTREQQKAFLKEYKIRSSLERLIHHYASNPIPQFSISQLNEQSEKLSDQYILKNAQNTIEHLMTYNARRLKEFRILSYLVVLNPSISESYKSYLQTMSFLITASLNPPSTLEANNKFCSDVLNTFIEVHADTLPLLSKGFAEVNNLISLSQIKSFLDMHLKERISMRLIAHQHIQLTKTLNDPETFIKGGKYNGVIKCLNIIDIIKRNAEHVNDICLMKYDNTVDVKIDTNLHADNYWSTSKKVPQQANEPTDMFFPYIDYHLDYILTELFKNSFRSHIENHVSDPVQVTISVSENPSFLELRIRDKGKGIPPSSVRNVFDYSFSTFEANEGESYKTLNVNPESVNSVAGMGYGLPLSKNYIEIFNEATSDRENDRPEVKGSLSIQSYYGWGTDVYLKTVGF